MLNVVAFHLASRGYESWNLINPEYTDQAERNSCRLGEEFTIYSERRKSLATPASQTCDRATRALELAPRNAG